MGGRPGSGRDDDEASTLDLKHGSMSIGFPSSRFMIQMDSLDSLDEVTEEEEMAIGTDAELDADRDVYVCMQHFIIFFKLFDALLGLGEVRTRTLT